MVDVVELRLGASPLLIDSDGDGLTDRFEIFELVGWTMPNRADTDGDGTPDGQEDTDNDGLTNLREQELGTSPAQFDPDGDGLTDVEEDEVLTDKNNVDSDGDGLSDGTEVHDWGIDPLAQDTDSDALRDDYETAHVVDQSLDSARPDEQVSKWTYVTDFAKTGSARG